MFRAIFPVVVFCFLFGIAKGQSQYKCFECSIPEAKKIAGDFSNMQETRLYCFLYGFTLGRCRNNSEYMEFANPLLFDILLHNSAALITILKKYPELDNNAVHHEIQHPLLDFNINRVSFVVDSANNKSKMKQKILDDLDAVEVDEKGYPR